MTKKKRYYKESVKKTLLEMDLVPLNFQDSNLEPIVSPVIDPNIVISFV